MAQVTNIKDSRMNKFLDEAEQDYEAFMKEQEVWEQTLEKYKDHPEVKGLIQEYRDIESSIGSEYEHEKMRIDNLGLEKKMSMELFHDAIEKGAAAGRIEEQIKAKIREIERKEGSNILRFSQF